jgi:predicted alpha/beta-fold hydrolase
MPIVNNSTYTHRPWYMPNSHWETIIPSALFKIKNLDFVRERIETIDSDFLDLDWLTQRTSRLVILSHGLEGSSDRHYIKRPAKFFYKEGWDVLAWNCRGCSGELNRLPKTYHHGFIDDLSQVIDHALTKGYDEVVLVGFSMGGNFTLKYLGMKGESVDKRIKAAIAFSVPCHLEDSSAEINKKKNRFYEKRFLRKLRNKIDQKVPEFPELKADWTQIKDFSDFNHKFTMPIYGFETEQAFYDQARSDVYLPKIKVPTLLVNALNDPMLGEKNYPYSFAEEAKFVWLETPRYGGHVGFTLQGDEYSWMEYRTKEFIAETVK